MNRIVGFVSVVLICSTVALVTSGESQPAKNEAGGKAAVRIGVFDSRALAVAYAASQENNRYAAQLMDELKKAKAASDATRAAALEQEARGHQDLLHKQGFGKWSVSNILESIKDQLPEIAQQAGVDLIVCKWDIVYQRPGVDFVDVTDRIVQHFEPSERTLKIIKDLQKREPIPLEELKMHKDY